VKKIMFWLLMLSVGQGMCADGDGVAIHCDKNARGDCGARITKATLLNDMNRLLGITIPSKREEARLVSEASVERQIENRLNSPFQVRNATLIDPCDSTAFTTSTGVLKLSDFRGRLFNIHSM